MKRQGKDMSKLYRVVGHIIDGFIPSRYQDHVLKGDFKAMRECHIEPDWLLTYIKTDTGVYLMDTGSHADIFGI